MYTYFRSLEQIDIEGLICTLEYYQMFAVLKSGRLQCKQL